MKEPGKCVKDALWAMTHIPCFVMHLPYPAIVGNSGSR